MLCRKVRKCQIFFPKIKFYLELNFPLLYFHSPYFIIHKDNMTNTYNVRHKFRKFYASSYGVYFKRHCVSVHVIRYLCINIWRDGHKHIHVE